MNHNDLNRAGLKATLPRLRILGILQASKRRHMSAEDLFKALLESGEDIGIATVHRNLTQFESAGLITRHRFEDTQSVFEIDEGKHHDHLLRVTYGRIEELVDQTIEKPQRKIAQERGFGMTNHSLSIYGTCDSCGGTR